MANRRNAQSNQIIRGGSQISASISFARTYRKLLESQAAQPIGDLDRYRLRSPVDRAAHGDLAPVLITGVPAVIENSLRTPCEFDYRRHYALNASQGSDQPVPCLLLAQTRSGDGVRNV
jgi:hypothetical protein